MDKNLVTKPTWHVTSAIVITLRLTVVCLLLSSTSWANSPPQDNTSYRGDVNGDFVVTLTEVVAVRDLTSLKPVDCTAVVPGTATKCDTLDFNGDGVVTLSDVVAIRDLTSLKPYTIPDGPWTLDTSEIPANITDSAPIQVAVTNIFGLGRSGIVVRFSVAATAEATLSGREYNPTDDGIRDHASPPGAKQVLAITQTDFPGDQTGNTELTVPTVGTPVELTCTGDGAITLNVEVLEDTLKGIPALIQSVEIVCDYNYVISGTVSGDVQAGVTVTLSGASSDSTTTDSSGNYSFVGLENGEYTVIPSLAGYIFNPVSSAVTISDANVTAIDFVATTSATSYSISGTVSYNGFGYPYVMVTLSGDASGSVFTDSNGNYTFAGLQDGSYNITPSEPGYTFSPTSSVQVISGANITGVDFDASGSSYDIFGNVWMNNYGPVQGVTLTLNTSPPQIAVTDGSGYYTISNIPNGTYDLKPTLAGTNAVFYPAIAQAITVNNSNLYQGFNMNVGYDISGTVSYGGAQSGRIYINVNWSGGGSTSYGTSISAEGAFTIQGVPPGDYTLSANMDVLGFGHPNASDPTGSSSVINVTNSDITGVALTLTDPVEPTPNAPLDLTVLPGNEGALIFWQGDYDGNDAEVATAYKIYWGTDVNASNGTPITVPANNRQEFFHSIANGTYYYKISALVGLNESATSTVVGPVTMATGSGPNTISGTVTIPVAPTGPLYVGLYLNSGGEGPGAFYLTKIASPSTSQAWSISGVPNGTYGAFALVDMNNNGINGDPGDLTNTNSDSGITFIVTGDMTGVDQILSGANATATVSTQHGNDNNGYEWYGLNLNVTGGTKLPVAVTLTSGPNVPVPKDLGNLHMTGEWEQYRLQVQFSPTRPSPGDTYTFTVTYSDLSIEDLNATVTDVLDSFALNLAVKTGAPYSKTVPLFMWTAPVAPPPSYFYRINIWPDMGGPLWWYPDNSYGMPSSQSSVPYNIDGNASQPFLVPGTLHKWQIEVIDENKNSAVYQTTYTPPVGGGGPIYSISGTVSGDIQAGVTMTLSGRDSGSTVTDGSGNYSFNSLPNGTYTVTPSLAGYTFNPASIVVTIDEANEPGINFVATANPASYSISGTVSGDIQAMVTVTLSGDSTGSTITDGSGNYSFDELPDGTYTVTPSLAGYIFSPASNEVIISGSDVSSINFVATDDSYSISGTVSGDVQAGVAMILSGDGSGSTITNSSGEYTLYVLPDGTYTITPSLGGYSFSPTNSVQVVSGADITDVDFTAAFNNTPPTWSPPPSSIAVNVNQFYSQNNGYSIDSDIPAQSLTCSSLGDVCSFPVNVSGFGIGAVNCVINFTAGSSVEACNVDVEVSDGFGGTITQNVPISVNNTDPYWSPPPSDIVTIVNQSYNQITGTAFDDDNPFQTLTCSSLGTTCSFPVNVSGNGPGATNCNINFTAGPAMEVCSVDVEVSDGVGGTVTQNVIITVNNIVWNPEPSDIYVGFDTAYNQNNGYAYDARVPTQNLTCSNIGDDCSFPVTVSGSGSGGVNCNISFTAGPGPTNEVCSVNIQVEDEIGGTITDNVIIQVSNLEWNPPPSDISVNVIQSYNQNNGNAYDVGNPSEPLTCAALGTTCSFPVTVSGAGTGSVDCNISFTAGTMEEWCSVDVEASDGLGTTIVDNVLIQVRNTAPLWSDQPWDIYVNLNRSYNENNGTAIDFDVPFQLLTCSSPGTTCSFPVTVSGSNVAGVDCDFSFTAGPTEESCTVDALVTDVAGGTTATQRVNILVDNNNPYWNPPPSNISVSPDESYNQNNGTATDGDNPPQTLSCSNTSDDCSFAVSVSGNGTGSATCNVTFTAGPAEEYCSVNMQVSDGAGGITTKNVKINVNHLLWNPLPSDISVPFNQIYNQNNGHAYDSYHPAQSLTCSKTSSNCSFPVTVTGNGPGAVDCNIDFTAGPGPTMEGCNVVVQASDGVGSAIMDVVNITVSACTGVVTFSDIELETVIRNEIGMPYGDIYSLDLYWLTTLDASFENISDISGLECATHLTDLNLNDNQIIDISPLAGLTDLTILSLDRNQIVDISPLTGLTNLTELRIESNQFVDISAVSGMMNLEVLRLGGNLITDVTPLVALSSLASLYELNISNNQLSNVSLTGFNNLTSFGLYQSNVTTLSLSGFNMVPSLDLSNNLITDLTMTGFNSLTSYDFKYKTSPLTNVTLSGFNSLVALNGGLNLIGHQIETIDLTGFTNLTQMYLNNNQISSITLSGFDSIEWFELQNNQITDIQSLVDTPGMGSGDFGNITGNPLSSGDPFDDPTCQTQVALLYQRMDPWLWHSCPNVCIDGLDNDGDTTCDIWGDCPGLDGLPGNAGVDDDGINGIDDPGEIGWPGSDDIVNPDPGCASVVISESVP